MMMQSVNPMSPPQVPASSAAAAQMAANAAAAADPNRKKTTGPLHNPRYKSIMCDHWERNNGTCPYAEKCQFAHGPVELAKWQAHRARMQQGQPQIAQPMQVPGTFVTNGNGTPSQYPMNIQMSPAMQLPPGTPHLSPPHQAQPKSIQAQMNPVPLHLSPVKSQAMNQEFYLNPQQQQKLAQQQHQYSNMIPMSPSSNYSQQQIPSPIQQSYQNNGNPVSYFQPSQQQQQQHNSQMYQQQQESPPGLAGQHMYQTQSTQHKLHASGNQFQMINNMSQSHQLYQQSQNESNIMQSHLYMRSVSPLNTSNGRHQSNLGHRQTPATSLSSSPPSASPFPMSIGYNQRPTSPETMLEIRSQDEATPRDPRRTASLPQLFSRDFMTSLSNNNDYDGFGSSRLADLPSPLPSAVNYPNYRRGSAPPIVLSAATNSLADLDSLADELVSEPSASQLFNMPTVFPGSIKGSINEYL